MFQINRGVITSYGIRTYFTLKCTPLSLYVLVELRFFPSGTISVLRTLFVLDFGVGAATEFQDLAFHPTTAPGRTLTIDIFS